MARLTHAELLSRRAFDYRTTMALTAPSIGAVRAFSSRAAFEAGDVITPERGERGDALLYRVPATFPIAIGPIRRIAGTEILFDLGVPGPEYPYAPPAVSILTRPYPFTPHVHPASGLVCIGEGFENAHGRMLLPQLVVHVMRLLNFDEPDREEEYVGWNEPAIRFWRQILRCRPLHPGLVYPTLPTHLTHGVPGDVGDAFVPTGNDMAFRPLATVARFDDAADGFRPVGGARW